MQNYEQIQNEVFDEARLKTIAKQLTDILPEERNRVSAMLQESVVVPAGGGEELQALIDAFVHMPSKMSLEDATSYSTGAQNRFTHFFEKVEDALAEVQKIEQASLE